jgi:glycosyltransferase involved in cell wall biosynthesis
VRIGIDMLAVQSPYSRGRGIGRYAGHLLASLLARDADHEYILYAHEGLPTDQFPASPRAEVRPLGLDSGRGERNLQDVVERLARTNPDGLDWLFLVSPFEIWGGYGLPARPLGGLKMAAVMYDFIPLLFQEQYLTEAAGAEWFYGHVERVRKYDRFLAISEATRADCLRLLGLPEDRVVTIGTASDPLAFFPDPSPPAAQGLFDRLGIGRPFVYCLGSMDDRKNLRGLIDAFRILPDELRLAHQLVIGCAMTGDEAARIRGYAETAEVGPQLVLTGELSDAEIRTLYQRCAAFAFPSLYEGFGLPVLEAMLCGAPVLAGSNSSQPEVVGDAGLLCNASDPADVSASLARLLADRPLAESLGKQAVARGRLFSWDEVACRVLDALDDGPVERPRAGRFGMAPAPRKQLRADGPHRGRPRRPKPRIAFFSPLPPKKSGISDYAAGLLHELAGSYTIDLYHDAGYLPDLGLGSPEFACRDYRLFPRIARTIGYRAVVYQMGNSAYHHFLYETMLRHPGVVTLHDFCLSGFQVSYSLRERGNLDHFLGELEHSHPDRSSEDFDQVAGWNREPGGLQDACARRDLFMNRRVIEHASRVVVHSEWCRDRISDLFPDRLGRTVVIPHGAEPREVTPGRRAAARARFGLPQDALIFGSFGILHPTKLNVEAIDAFATLALDLPRVLLLFVGQDLGLGEARQRVNELDLQDRVRFFGRQSAADFSALVEAIDVGVSLRQPPTNGETSGALLHLLAAGVPTVVTDVGTFSGYPDHVVHKVPWDRRGLSQLALDLRALADDGHRREALGRAAIEHVRERHDWPRVAELYVSAIEESAAMARLPGGGPPSSPRSPRATNLGVCPRS